MYKVTKRIETVYSVDGQDFSNHLTALNHASWLDCFSNLTKHYTLEDTLKNAPEAALIQLQAYISARKYNEHVAEETTSKVKCLPHFPGSEFDYDKAWKAEDVPGDRLYIQSPNDMMDRLARMQTENKKIAMIKLVRSCYTPTPGLKECKDYVEDTFFR